MKTLLPIVAAVLAFAVMAPARGADPGAAAVAAAPPATAPGGRIFASPLARRVAKELDVDLARVRGSGPNGRVVRADVQAAAAAQTRASSASAPAPAAAPVPAAAAVAPVVAPVEERINLNFRAAPIEEVFDMLSRKDQVNIVLSKGVTGPVSVNLYGVSVKEAIYGVAKAAGYWVETRNGDYVILGKETGVDYPSANTQIRTFKVQYSDTKQVGDILAKYVSRYGKITPLIGRKLIVVEDLPGFVERIGKLLEDLDVQPKQVMIEAKILEVTLDESENFGVDWKKIFGSAGNTSGSFGTSGLAVGSAAKPSQGFFFSLLDRHLEAFLSALAAKGRIRTLSTPKLLALENQESKAVIGDSTGYRVTTTINLVTTETVQFLESGVILKVTPSVDQQGRVLLRVHPEVSSATLVDGIPSKKSTEVTTELICEDGQSIFIGGLIKGKSSLERQGVPVLGDLPVIGGLFSNRQEAVNSSETVVIITPYVVREPRDADRLSEEKVRQAETISGAIREDQGRLLRGGSTEFEAP